MPEQSLINAQPEIDELADVPPTGEADEFTQRLRQVVTLVGSVSALAKKAGISHSGLLRYLAGGDPSRKVLVALAQAAHVELTWLATGKGAMTDAMPKQTLTLLPRYDNPGQSMLATPPGAAALTELAFCRAWLTRNGLDYTHLKAITVQGDSMAPQFIQGDTLLIDITKKEVVDGKVYLIEDSGNLLLRRLQLEVGGRLRLVSDNVAYRAVDLEAEQLSIVGRVVWSARLA